MSIVVNMLYCAVMYTHGGVFASGIYYIMLEVGAT
jgi:hypothetical protein